MANELGIEVPIKSSWKTYLGAFTLFNLYSLFFVSAFQESTGYTLATKEVLELGIDPREWGWGDHYVWRLIASILVTALAGMLAGAFARSKGAMVGLISNIPSCLFHGFIIYMLVAWPVEVVAQTAFVIVSIIMIPLTSLIAYWSGELGENINIQIDHGRVLGIRGYHWFWLVIPLYWYARCIIPPLFYYLVFELIYSNSLSIFTGIKGLILLIPIVGYVYPLYMAYRILSSDVMGTSSTVVRALSVTGWLVGGLAIGGILQYGCYKVLGWGGLVG